MWLNPNRSRNSRSSVLLATLAAALAGDWDYLRDEPGPTVPRLPRPPEAPRSPTAQDLECLRRAEEKRTTRAAKKAENIRRALAGQRGQSTNTPT